MESKMVFIGKKKQQKRLLSQSREFDKHFMTGQSSQGDRTEGRDNLTYRGISLDNRNDATTALYPQVEMHTFEENIVSKVWIEVDSVMTMVETRV